MPKKARTSSTLECGGVVQGLFHVILGLVLAWGNGLEAQETDAVWQAVVGVNLSGPSVSHGDGFQVSASNGVLVGALWDPAASRLLTVQAQADMALGTTVAMRDGRSECRDDDPGGRARFCTSRATPQLGVLRLTAGPVLRIHVFHVGLGAGARMDLGGWQEHDCVMLDRPCLALQDYPWPGLSAQFRVTGGLNGSVAGRPIRVEVGEWMAPRSGGRLRERSVTVGVGWR